MKIEKKYIELMLDMQERLEEAENKIKDKELLENSWYKNWQEEKEKISKVQKIINEVRDEYWEDEKIPKLIDDIEEVVKEVKLLED